MKVTKKQHEARVNRVMGQAINCIQINIMDLSKVSRKVEEALARGESDEIATESVRAFALTIGKHNP